MKIRLLLDKIIILIKSCDRRKTYFIPFLLYQWIGKPKIPIEVTQKINKSIMGPLKVRVCVKQEIVEETNAEEYALLL